MSRTTFLVIASVMTVAAAAVRLNNALSFPVLGGYDAFAHFTYIWFVATTGRIPLADQGWEFFQPPLYYELMALVWRLAGAFDAEVRLRIGTVLIALAGLIPAATAFAIVRQRFPSDRLVQLLAAGAMLFLPMQLYSAGFVGNENLTAILGNLALLALVWTLREETTAHAAMLGVVLGLAMLTKFTGVVVVAGAISTLALRGIVRRDFAGAAGTVAIVVVAMLAVCGGYYVRNVREFGTPFQLSRTHLFLKRVEDSQLQGRRELLEYLLFDPGIIYRPQWPRGLSLNSPRPPDSDYSAMRESIPTGIYANTWFDGFGGFVLTPVTHSEASRRAGQLLLLLAVVPTSIMLLGIAVSVQGLWRRGWDDTAVAMLTTLAAMAAVVVHGTRSVPTQAAVKATYLLLVGSAFAYMFAAGFVFVGARSRRLQHAAAWTCAGLALASAIVFAHGRFLPDDWFVQGFENATVQNMYGVLHYAGGDRTIAQEKFEAAAARGLHLGYENLAALAFESGKLDAAEYFLRAAALRQPGQSRGTPAQREEAITSTQAEYSNALAVFDVAGGDLDGAREELERSRRYDRSIPESAFNLGVVHLLEALRAPAGEARTDSLRRADEELAASAALDPGFADPVAMRGVVLALQGDCRAAVALLARARPVTGSSAERPPQRSCPVETGPGDLNAAGLLRRRKIETLPAELSPAEQLRRCEAIPDRPAAT